MDEAYMETCLKAAFSRPMSGNLRVSAMNRESASRMLDKPLMAVLIVAAHERNHPQRTTMTIQRRPNALPCTAPEAEVGARAGNRDLRS